MQLRPLVGLVTVAGVLAGGRIARADDVLELSTTWYQEQRQGGLGGLTVIHPQFDVGVAGDLLSLDLGYSADAVSGATATVYKTDAVSSATEFSDLRHEGSIGVGVHGKRSQFGVHGSVGVERDYLSLTVGGSGAIDLPGKNTNVALAYTHNFDQVCDKDNALADIFERRALTGVDPCTKNYVFGEDTPGETVWRDLSIDTVQGTVTQNLTPTMNLQLSAFGQIIHGFQANPYRRVRVGQNEPQEHVPEVRGRLAISARLNRFFPKLRAALHVDTRYYSDTWGVNSGTGELAWSQYAGSSLLLRLRARVYQQSAATFFKDAFFYETESAAGEYFTGDRELAPVRNILLGGKLTVITVAEDDHAVWGLFDKLQLNLKADVLLLDELPADDPDANLAGRDGQFLSSNQLLDAFVLQLGLLADY
ncbi:MAG: DUF3570 domain-containing protein [Kofleriaceae bacterium]|nr:DUF3570 domain-containing protein [Kofleriaceae bacterium]